jgi:hypothetical protein
LRVGGARLDLEGAAGIGRLDAVKGFFNEDGTLKPPATEKQMKDGFMSGCGYGRTNAVEFLLRRGVGIDAMLKHDGATGLHRLIDDDDRHGLLGLFQPPVLKFRADSLLSQSRLPKQQ